MKPLKVLVTAGSTMTMIDQVRAITNIFHGRTGCNIAGTMIDEGHNVTLLSSDRGECSRLELNVYEWSSQASGGYRDKVPGKLACFIFSTFEDLERLMQEQIRNGGFDLIVHSAAVSDYKVVGVFMDISSNSARPILEPVLEHGKISSKHDVLYLKLEPTPKLIDKIRTDWGFKGTLVKFRLQVGLSDEGLIEIATKSRAYSNADMIVANCLEWAHDRAYVIGSDNVPESVKRNEIAAAILRRVP